MKIQYIKEEIVDLFNNFPSTELIFDINNLKKRSSALNVTLFNKYNINLELLYFNHKFKYLYDDIDNITLQIYDKELYFLDTVNVLPFQDLFSVLKQRTTDYDNLLLILLPSTKEAYNDPNTNVFNYEKLRNYAFIAFDLEGDINGLE